MGYKIEEIVLSEEIQKISATKIDVPLIISAEDTPRIICDNGRRLPLLDAVRNINTTVVNSNSVHTMPDTLVIWLSKAAGIHKFIAAVQKSSSETDSVLVKKSACTIKRFIGALTCSDVEAVGDDEVDSI